jgi:hypothetical protein
LRVTPILLFCLPLLLAGCSLTPTATPSSSPGAAISGRVHGGQQPISGAQVYLFAANTTGYGGNGIAPTSLNVSVSLLQNVSGTTVLDTSGGPTNGDYYVTTDANGAFSLSGDYTCTPGQQVYIYALGGNPGLTAGTDNTLAGLLAVLGNCPSADNFAAVSFVLVNEVTTVAAAYAMAPFASDALHVSSSGTPLALAGITNAFANAANLATLSGGGAPTYTPGTNPATGYGIVPQMSINTIADILASCINTDGTSTSGTNCNKIVTNAMSAGSSGTAPSDTATAAINIAHNPGKNVSTLLSTVPATGAPFVPSYHTNESYFDDFTLGIQFDANSLGQSSGIAIDASGNVWIGDNYYVVSSGTGLTELTSLGVPVTATGYTGGGLDVPEGIAIDSTEHVWLTNGMPTDTGGVSEFTNTGSPVSSTAYANGGGNASNTPRGIAFDQSGNAWIVNSSANSLIELSTADAAVGTSPFSGGGLAGPLNIAIDGLGDAWVTNQSYNSSTNSTTSAISEFSTSGSPLSSATGFTGNTNLPSGIAIDSGGNIWIANQGNSSVTKLANSGASLSGTGGFTGGGLVGPSGIAIDGAGNVWVSNTAGYSITELSSSGSAISPTSGYGNLNSGGFLDAPGPIAIDGSGDVWAVNRVLTNGSRYPDSGNYYIIEFIGAAAPVITPLSAGLGTTFSTDGSSKLGTRP